MDALCDPEDDTWDQFRPVGDAVKQAVFTSSWFTEHDGCLLIKDTYDPQRKGGFQYANSMRGSVYAYSLPFNRADTGRQRLLAAGDRPVRVLRCLHGQTYDRGLWRVTRPLPQNRVELRRLREQESPGDAAERTRSRSEALHLAYLQRLVGDRARLLHEPCCYTGLRADDGRHFEYTPDMQVACSRKRKRVDVESKCSPDEASAEEPRRKCKALAQQRELEVLLLAGHGDSMRVVVFEGSAEPRELDRAGLERHLLGAFAD